MEHLTFLLRPCSETGVSVVSLISFSIICLSLFWKPSLSASLCVSVLCFFFFLSGLLWLFSSFPTRKQNWYGLVLDSNIHPVRYCQFLPTRVLSRSTFLSICESSSGFTLSSWSSSLSSSSLSSSLSSSEFSRTSQCSRRAGTYSTVTYPQEMTMICHWIISAQVTCFVNSFYFWK